MTQKQVIIKAFHHFYFLSFYFILPLSASVANYEMTVVVDSCIKLICHLFWGVKRQTLDILHEFLISMKNFGKMRYTEKRFVVNLWNIENKSRLHFSVRSEKHNWIFKTSALICEKYIFYFSNIRISIEYTQA